ncbi:MAG: hypothetical protein WC579_01550 [Candidatus Paceibacterota bacterium]
MITKIQNGKILMTQSLLDAIRKNEGRQVVIEIKRYYPKKDRSAQQNRYMWGVVYQILSDFTGHSPEEIHEAMKYEFLLEKGSKLKIPKSTTELSTIEMEDYLSKIREFASMELGVYIPSPNEYYI